MTRPASHTSDRPRSCCNCKHAVYTPFRNDLLCCHGDEVVLMIDDEQREGPQVADEINGIDVFSAEGDEYDKVWAGRPVCGTDTCDEWEERE